MSYLWGHQVTIVRVGDRERIHGTLHEMDAVGAHVWVPSKTQLGEGENRFIPMAIIEEIIDRGVSPR